MKHHTHRTKNQLPLCVLLLGALMSASCESTSRVSSDARFASAIARGMKTKRALHLYPPGIGVSDSGESYSLSAGLFSSREGAWDYVATVPAHHPVCFEQVRKTYDITGGGEYLLGSLELRGKTYRVSYWLGLLNDDSKAGWKGFYKSFE
jgi:hypothetical protein